MEDINKTVHYVTKDPLQNLKIRVTLTRLSVAKPKSNVNASAYRSKAILPHKLMGLARVCQAVPCRTRPLTCTPP